VNKLAAEIVYEALDEINEDQAVDAKILKSLDGLLLSAGSNVDSLTLVRLLVTVERLIEEKSDKAIVLVDESAFDEGHSPFSTVGTLVLHVEKLLA